MGQKEIKTPTTSEQDRSLAIRCASKQGLYVSNEDRDWNLLMFSTYPEWYRSTEHVVYQRTKPFGAM